MIIVKFLDDEDIAHYGVLCDDKIVCGCCGGVFDIYETEILARVTVDLENELRRYIE